MHAGDAEPLDVATRCKIAIWHLVVILPHGGKEGRLLWTDLRRPAGSLFARTELFGEDSEHGKKAL